MHTFTYVALHHPIHMGLMTPLFPLQRQQGETVLSNTTSFLHRAKEVLGDVTLPARPETMPSISALPGDLEDVTLQQTRLYETLKSSGRHPLLLGCPPPLSSLSIALYHTQPLGWHALRQKPPTGRS